jgi:hypothetical protein
MTIDVKSGWIGDHSRIVVLPAYKNGTNDGMPASFIGKIMAIMKASLEEEVHSGASGGL